MIPYDENEIAVAKRRITWLEERHKQQTDKVNSYVIASAKLTERIAELQQQIEAERAKVDAEHEAYVDLFHQLSAYEKREIAERANAQLVIHALTFYRTKYEQFGQSYVGCASDALAALQDPEVKP